MPKKSEKSKETSVKNSKKKTANYKRKKENMTEEEKKEWDELYKYVHDKVMKYDSNQRLSSAMCVRLKGLRKGKFMDNRNTEDYANYPFEAIRAAFVVSMSKINSAFTNTTFKNEMHKLNYACKIAEPEINNVYERMKRMKRSMDATKYMDTATMLHEDGATYTNKTDKTLKSLDNLW